MLTDCTFSASYSSEETDIAASLYLPAMRESVSYDRIAGFFSSTVLTIAWPSLKLFVERNGGRIRILCSPRLAEQDAEGIVYGYQARDQEALARQLQQELEALLNEPRLRAPTRLLTALIASGVVDVRFAVVDRRGTASTRRMFHDKVGLFADAAGNRVGFRGTFNETWLGLGREGNIESVDVWTSWEDSKDLQRLSDAVQRFESLWDGVAPGVQVLRLPETTLEYIRQLANDVDESLLLRELEAVAENSAPSELWTIGDRTLRLHQQRAVEAWRSNAGRGLLAHATGSGKTTTGLYCIDEALTQGLRPIVVVPSRLLLNQWADEVHGVLGARTLLCGGGHDHWKNGNLATALGDGQRRVIIAVVATASSTDFIAQVRRHADNVLLVADEAHRLGSPQHQQILEGVPATQRLGLSATPERAGDAEGSLLLDRFFGGVIDSYSIKDALDDGVLASYEYAAEFVHLTDSEQELFEELTQKIKRQTAMAMATDASDGSKDRLKRLLIDRARVIKNASAKPAKAAEILRKLYQSDDRWLVYCDNRNQVAEVRHDLADAGIQSWEYYRGMEGDADNTLKAFESNGGVVVSIRCLDEGVDLPAADHALILASSRNPREHIQRRGRVLRRAPFKTIATLIDVLTLPRTVDREDGTIGTVTGEVARAMEFARWSLTRTAEVRVREKWVEMGLDLGDLPGAATDGIEDDVPEEEQ